MGNTLLLLVDDAPDLGVIVTFLGRRFGHEVEVRADVESAWHFLQDRRPDLLLLDVNLPGLSGLELCRRIRTTPAQATLPVALFTHGGIPADVAAAIDTGVDFMVSKDLVSRPADWQRRMDEILMARDGRPAAAGVAWQWEGGGNSPSDPIVALNAALEPAARYLSPPVARAVLRRALVTTFVPAAAPAAFNPWVGPEGLLRPKPKAIGAIRDAAAGKLAAVLAELLWCLLGSEASEPFRAALARAVPASGPRTP